MDLCLLMLLMILKGGNGAYEQRVCADEEKFLCPSSGDCIVPALLCDGVSNCPKGEDETWQYAECGECPPRKQLAARKQCKPRCTSDEDCGRNRRCLCDPPCGLSCVKPECRNRIPRRPPDLSTSRTIYRFDTSYYRGHLLRKVEPQTAPPWKFGDVVQYKCELGMVAVGGEVRCASNGKWSTEKVQCVSVFCGNPVPSIRAVGGFVNTTSRAHTAGEIVRFSCYKTHLLQGSRTRTCLLTGKWSESLAVCQRQATTNCPQRNSNFARKLGVRECKPACSATAPCTGSASCGCDGICGMSCLKSRTVASQCTDPGVPINGRRSKRVGDLFRVGSSVTFTCRTGYLMKGDANQECLSSSLWSGGGAPECLRDLSKCGAVDRVAKKFRPNFGRIASGTKSARYWPWHIMVMHLSEPNDDAIESIDYADGGAALINSQWAVSAAHVFHFHWDQFVFAAGILKKETARTVSNSSPLKFFKSSTSGIIKHQGYQDEDKREKFYNDIALIRIGEEWEIRDNRFQRKHGGFNGEIPLSRYIRPVCLPCSGTCVTRDHLVDTEGISLITEDMTEEQKCEQEGKWLLDRRQEESHTSVELVVKGFGNTIQQNTTSFDIERSNVLREARLHPKSENYCRNGISIANERMKIKLGVEYKSSDDYVYPGSHFCTTDAVNVFGDACKGDSGGAVVRLIIGDTPDDTCWIVVGLVSFGTGCGGVDERTSFQFPGYNTDVSKMHFWIDTELAKKCPELAVSSNGQVSCSNSNLLASVCTYTCNNGYDLLGSETIKCEVFAQRPTERIWNPSPPVCLPKVCGDAPNFSAHPRVHVEYLNGSSGSFGDIISITCDEWYEVSKGASKWQCGAFERWIPVGNFISTSDNLPICSIQCGVKNYPQTTLEAIDKDTTISQNPNEFPWLALVREVGIGPLRRACTGSLVNSRFVAVTAGCLLNFRNPAEAEVWLGAHDMYLPNPARTRRMTVSEFIVHPDSDKIYLDSDYGLIRLEEEVTMTNVIRPICLPKTAQDYSRLQLGVSTGVSAGWGAITSRLSYARMQSGKLHSLTKDDCRERMVAIVTDEGSFRFTDNMFCGGPRDGSPGGAALDCQGNMGVNYMLQDPVTNKWYVHGLGSFVVEAVGIDVDCSFEGFSKINKKAADWIRAEIGDDDL